MIKFTGITREAFNVRSSGDNRKRVDAYFIEFTCPPDANNPGPHEWIRRFEVPVGTELMVPKTFPDKAAAIAASGWKL